MFFFPVQTKYVFAATFRSRAPVLPVALLPRCLAYDTCMYVTAVLAVGRCPPLIMCSAATAAVYYCWCLSRMLRRRRRAATAVAPAAATAATSGSAGILARRTQGDEVEPADGDQRGANGLPDV